MTRRRLALLHALVFGLGLLVGCGSNPLRRTLSFAEVQMLNRGLSGEWIYQEYPNARVQRWPNGNIRQMEYAVTDPQQKRQSLFLEFDRAGTLVRKRYSGRLLRPPPQE